METKRYNIRGVEGVKQFGHVKIISIDTYRSNVLTLLLYRLRTTV